MAAALLGLLLLSYASVRATVMQAAMAGPAAAMPMCGEAPGPSTAGQAKPGERSRPAAPAKSCPYCAAAAHLPIACGAAPVLASGTVQFVAYRRAPLHGPRGPPRVQPRARGPPAEVLSI